MPRAAVFLRVAGATALALRPTAFRNASTNPFLGEFCQPDHGRAPNDEKHHFVAAGTISESLILAKSAAEGINYQPGWILGTTAMIKVFIAVLSTARRRVRRRLAPMRKLSQQSDGLSISSRRRTGDERWLLRNGTWRRSARR